jgi:hypothetical protein
MAKRGNPNLVKGVSGNPNGRPKGSKNKSAEFYQGLFDGKGKALIEKCVEMALAGNPVALKLAIDRLAPPRKILEHDGGIEVKNVSAEQLQHRLSQLLATMEDQSGESDSY